MVMDDSSLLSVESPGLASSPILAKVPKKGEVENVSTDSSAQEETRRKPGSARRVIHFLDVIMIAPVREELWETELSLEENEEKDEEGPDTKEGSIGQEPSKEED